MPPEIVPIAQTLGPVGTLLVVAAWVVRDYLRSRNGSAPTTKVLQETVVKELKETNEILRGMGKRQEDIWNEILRQRE